MNKLLMFKMEITSTPYFLSSLLFSQLYHVISPDFQYQDDGTAGPPPPNPTTQGPTTEAPPPSDCIDQWIEDGYCDDENNNAACQFDGGDCCANTMENWNMYCNVSNQGHSNLDID